ncbi:histidine kinase [Dyadobacter bucti]|uniref:histidine kinase n=1 Tax=Dyadobacter bucti TaxID=2572203 RepID=UPI0035B6A07A
MASLRSQMNPHFIFNCLNSIQFFSAQNDSEKASNYLSNFSRLIRLVLEKSKSKHVTLANELETHVCTLKWRRCVFRVNWFTRFLNIRCMRPNSSLVFQGPVFCRKHIEFCLE